MLARSPGLRAIFQRNSLGLGHLASALVDTYSQNTPNTERDENVNRQPQIFQNLFWKLSFDLGFALPASTPYAGTSRANLLQDSAQLPGTCTVEPNPQQGPRAKAAPRALQPGPSASEPQRRA